MKRVGILALALCIIFSAVSLPTGCYALDRDSKEEVAIYGDTEYKDDNASKANYIILDQSISSYGASWNQPGDCNAYRIWVENTTNEKMVVTVTYKKGLWGTGSHIMTVSANSNNQFTVNNAVKGLHDVDFTTSSGLVSGTIRVRVSDQDL